MVAAAQAPLTAPTMEDSVAYGAHRSSMRAAQHAEFSVQTGSPPLRKEHANKCLAEVRGEMWVFSFTERAMGACRYTESMVCFGMVEVT